MKIDLNRIQKYYDNYRQEEGVEVINIVDCGVILHNGWELDNEWVLVDTNQGIKALTTDHNRVVDFSKDFLINTITETNESLKGLTRLYDILYGVE